MPIDPSMLAKSIGTLTDLHPDQDLPATLQQAVIAAKQLFEADAAGVMLVDLDGTLERRWGEIALVFVEVHIRSGLSVPVDLGGGPIGTLDVYVAAPPGLGRQRGNRPAGLCRGSGQPAQRGGQGPPARGVGRPAPDRVGLPGLHRAGHGGADGARAPDDQEALTHLRRAAQSTRAAS